MNPHCPGRTNIISDTLPNGIQFSHFLAEEVHSGTPADHQSTENLFREPEFAPGTAPPAQEPSTQDDDRASRQRTSRRPARTRTRSPR